MTEKGKSIQTIERFSHKARLDELSNKVRDTFGIFGVSIEMIEVKVFPDGLCFLFRPTEPVRMHVIRSFEDDLRFALGRSHIEIMAPIPDEQMVGVTVFMDVQKEIYGIESPQGIESPWTTDIQEEALFEEAKMTIIESEKISASFLQRKFGIGYTRALKLIDLLEERGIVGPDDGSGEREVYPDR